ncbi:MAG: hypothetical protein ACK415_00360 [Thermodesulfovibrionales bacterium]
MADNEYICLDCGRQFVLKATLLKKSDARCPYCNGERLMKLSPSSWLGFFGGGGG